MQASDSLLLAHPRSRLTRRLGIGAEPWLYLGPALVILGVFHVLPILYVVWLSLHRGTALFDPHWVGFSNYRLLFTDPSVRDALVATIEFTLGTVPVGAAIALGLALLLFEKLPG